MEEYNNENMDQQLDNTQPAENGNQSGGRLFSQEEVNEIIRIRLERERKKHEPKEPTEAEKREAALLARESRLKCKEHLHEMQLPYDLLDVFDTSDVNKFDRNVQEFMRVLDKEVIARQPVAPLRSTEPENVYLNAGFGFDKKKHEPRQFPPSFDNF